MLFLLIGDVVAEYFRFTFNNAYLGEYDTSSSTIGPVDDRSKALNFTRMPVDHMETHTTLKTDDGRVVTDGADSQFALKKNGTPAKFVVALDLNGKYVLMAGKECLAAETWPVTTVPCTELQKVAYFDILPTKRKDALYLEKPSVILPGASTDPVREDPLMDQLENGYTVPASDLEKLLLPYAKRLADKQEVASKSSNSNNAGAKDLAPPKRRLAKLGIF